MKIYDAFLFFNELDLLEMRLELLYDHVDYFIISECDSTFSGIKKPFYFEENKERYTKYLDKIIYIKNENSEVIDNITNPYTDKKFDMFNEIISYYNEIKNTPETGNGVPHWCRDFLHREFVRLGMVDCQLDDVIIFSDLDEIPNPSKLVSDGGKYCVKMKNMMYYINVENITQVWYGSIIFKYSDLLGKSLGHSRKYREQYNMIENGGWHLSFMGGSDRITEKLKSYGHQEYNNLSIINQISFKMDSNLDILNRGIQLMNIDFNSYYPNNIINMVNEKFKYLLK